MGDTGCPGTWSWAPFLVWANERCSGPLAVQRVHAGRPLLAVGVCLLVDGPRGLGDPDSEGRGLGPPPPGAFLTCYEASGKDGLGLSFDPGRSP